MVTAAIICAAAGLLLLLAGIAWLNGWVGAGGERPAAEWRDRTAETAADFRDWLRLGR